MLLEKIHDPMRFDRLENGQYISKQQMILKHLH